MRPVKGLDRPGFQWALLGACAVLMVVVVGLALTLRRSAAVRLEVEDALVNARADGDRVELQLMRERSAREALALEAARQRTDGPRAAFVPTLTVTPSRTRRAQPPEPTVAPPSRTQVIELRLVLPPGVPAAGEFTIAVRDWSTGDVLWSRGGLTSTASDRGAVLSTYITGDLLPHRALEIVVTGPPASAPVASYELTVGGQPR